MARLTRTQKFAALREELANSSEESHVNEDLNKFQDKLNSLETAFNKETETKKEDFNLNVDPIPSFEEVKQEATLEEVKPEEETKTSEELENNFLKDFDFENINKAIDEIVKQNVANLDNNQDVNIDSTSVFNTTNQFVNPGSEYVEDNTQEEPEASFEPVQEPKVEETQVTEEPTKEEVPVIEEASEPVVEVEESSVIEEAPTVEDVPAEEVKEELDSNPTVVEETPVEEAVVEETPVEEEPVEETPVEEPSTEPVEEEPKEGYNPDGEPVEETLAVEESVDINPVEEEPVDENPVNEENIEESIPEVDDSDDSALNDFDLDLSGLSIPDFTEEAADITALESSDEEGDAIEAKEATQEIPVVDETIVEDVPVEEVKEELDSNPTVIEETPVEEVPTEPTLEEEPIVEEPEAEETPTIEEPVEEEPEEELHFVEKDYNELANDLAKEVEELDGKVEPVKEEPVEETSIEEETIEGSSQSEETTVEESKAEEEPEEEKEVEENPTLSNSDISSLLDSALAEAKTYNSQAGRSTVEQISNDLIDEVRHGNLPESDDDDEFSNTVTLEIDKVLSEINLDTMSSLKIDDVLEDKKEVEPLEVKPEDVAEKLADTIAHPVLAKSLEEEPVEIKSMEETFTNDVTTSTIAFDNKKLEKEDTSEEDYYYDDDKPNKILNVILVILMVMLVAIIGVIVYYILYAKGVIG